jgi:hypothetical protein
MRPIALEDGFADELWFAAAQLKRRARKPSGVEHDPNLLRPLCGELPRHKFAASCCGRPRDTTQFIAVLEIPQALELAACSPQLQLATLQFNLARAE